jgi:hypothetical protein
MSIAISNLMLSEVARASQEIDAMISRLSETLISGDRQGYAEIAVDYIAVDKRFESYDKTSLKKKIFNLFDSTTVFGSFISGKVASKNVCGDAVTRVVWIGFQNEGQIAIEYWFFNISGRWSLSSLNLKGQGTTNAFVAELKKLMDFRC